MRVFLISSLSFGLFQSIYVLQFNSPLHSLFSGTLCGILFGMFMATGHLMSLKWKFLEKYFGYNQPRKQYIFPVIVACILSIGIFSYTDRVHSPAKTTTLLVLNPTLLNEIQHSDISTIERYFTGNPAWFVTEDDGVKVAILRERAKINYELGYNGFIYGFNGNWAQVKVILEERRPRDWWDLPGRAQIIEPSPNPASVYILNSSEFNLNSASYVSIKGKAPLRIEIYEENTPTHQREATLYYTYFVNEKLKKALQHKDELAKWGLIKSDLKDYKEVPKLTIDCEQGDPECRENRWAVSYTFNPKEAGTAQLKAKKRWSNEYLDEDHISQSTLAYMGWSHESQQFFLYNSSLYFSDSSIPIYNIEIELWFQPQQGGAARKITSAPLIKKFDCLKGDPNCKSTQQLNSILRSPANMSSQQN